MKRAATILRLRGVARSFSTAAGTVHALRHADLDLLEGEIVALTGRSGAGKTTLLNIAALLDRPTAGSVEYGGRPLEDLDDRARCDLRKRHLGIVFQDDALLPNRTAYENVLFRFRYLDTPPREARLRSAHALQRVGLAARAEQPAYRLSGGESRRVAIARAIAVDPDAIVADEPTANLDDETAHSVIECLEQLNAEGASVLVVTHETGWIPANARTVTCADGIVAGAVA